MKAYHLFLLAGVATVLPAPPAVGQLPAGVRPPPVVRGGAVARGSLSGSENHVHRMTLDTAGVGWAFMLFIASVSELDLDLFVYLEDPDRVRGVQPSCSSEGLGQVEQCRIVPRPGGGAVWVKVEAAGGGGRSNYVVQGQPIRGPLLEGTSFVVSDATPLQPRQPSMGKFGTALAPGTDPYSHLYVVSPRQSGDARGWLVSAIATDPAMSLAVTVFDGDGRRIAAGDKPAVGQYVPLDAAPPGPWFVLVKSARARGVRLLTYVVSAVPKGEATPAEVIDGEFRASGEVDRDYSVLVPGGRTGVIVLEGAADMRVVASDSSVVPVASTFGGLKQIAWLGTGLANSSQVLVGPKTSQPIRVSIKARAPSTVQSFGDKPQWALRVQVAVKEGTYVVRLPPQGADNWSSWWSDLPASRDGAVKDRSVGVIRLPAPPQALAPQGAQPAPNAQQSPSPSTRFGVLARLVEGPGGGGALNLAVCLESGQVLDIGNSSVRWQWPTGAAAVYLVVFPTPWNAAQAGGTFRVEVTQSVASAAY